MRERFDFSSISKIILENRKTGMLSQTEYFFNLFAYAFEQEDVKITVPEDAEISKVISGQRNVPKDIIYIYQAPEGESKIEKPLEKIFECLSDGIYVKEQIYQLLWGDASISQAKRQGLSNCYDDTIRFVAECLLFGLSRGFLPKRKKGAGQTLKLSDYLLDTRLPSVTRNFVGRDRELMDIHDLLQQERAVFLEGIGGIGKSELAKQYGHQFEKQYTNVLYLRYNDNLRRTITGMDFVDDRMDMSEEELFRSHYRFFKLLDGQSLVILDNFNSVPENDDLFHEFFDLRFQVLVTSRSHITEMAVYEIKEISDMEIIKHLFWIYAPGAESEKKITEEIIEEVYRHTLTVELAAKTLKASGMEPKQFLQTLQTDGLGIENPNKVVLTKDNTSKKQRLYQHIQTLFQIQRLSKTSIYILRNMVLMPSGGISKRLFHEWQGIIDWNSTNDLIEYGWIQEDLSHEKIALHPYIQEVLRLETKPAITNCAFLIKGIYEICVRYGEDIAYYNELLNAVESIYEHIILDDEETAGLFMDTTMSYLMKYDRVEAISRILKRMKRMSTFRHSKRQMGIYDCYAGYVEYMKSDYQMAQQYYLHGLQLLEPFHPVYADLYSNLYNNLAQAHFAVGEIEKALSEIEKAIQIRQEFGTVETHDTLQQAFTYAQLLAAKGNWQLARKNLFALIRQVKKFKEMKLFLSRIYFVLATIEQTKFPEDSLEHYRKAKEVMLQGYLPPDHPDVARVDRMITRQTGLVKGVQAGRLKIVSRQE